MRSNGSRKTTFRHSIGNWSDCLGPDLVVPLVRPRLDTGPDRLGPVGIAAEPSLYASLGRAYRWIRLIGSRGMVEASVPLPRAQTLMHYDVILLMPQRIVGKRGCIYSFTLMNRRLRISYVRIIQNLSFTLRLTT